VAEAEEPREAMLEVLAQFRVLVRAIREHYRHVEEKSSIGGAQLWALSEIAAEPDLSVGDLARRLAVHISTASNLVGRLEELGLVERKRVSRDQRVVQLSATALGRRTVKSAPQPAMGLLQQALLDLPPERLKALRRELAEVLARMKLRSRRAAHELPIAELLSEPGAAPGARKRAAKRGAP
jgi:DNA-binding MarR family transcriptional regulator